MKTLSKLSTPELLADHVIKLLKRRDSFTIDTSTGLNAGPSHFAVGGMIRTYGNLNSLYYSPSGVVDRDDLVHQLAQNWEAIKIYGYLGVWTCRGSEGKDLFIDSVYLVPCGCDTYAGPSQVSLTFARNLAESNGQISMAHLCDTEHNSVKEIII